MHESLLPREIKKSNKNKTIIITSILCIIPTCFIIIFLILFIIWLIIGAITFEIIFGAGPDFSGCDANARWNTPWNFTSFQNCQPVYNVNMTRWWIPRENTSIITFKSRDPEWIKLEGGNISAYLFENANKSAPIVIVVHGIRQCNRHFTSLLPSGMLWHAGYHVLALDLRNHGMSDNYQFQYPYVTFGSEEHKDVLGAFDYLLAKFGNSAKIGIYGVSMGAATVIIAFGKEPRFKAVFADSPPCMVWETISNGIKVETGIDGPLIMGAVCAVSKSKTKYGCPPFENDPLEIVKTIGKDRPIHFDQGEEDILVPAWNVEKCASVAQEAGADVTVTYVKTGIPSDKFGKCDNHIFGMVIDPIAYEKRLLAFFNKHLK